MLRIVVMARWPSPGRCKRRLSLDLRCQLGLHHSGERAMRIQRKLTEHTVAVLHSMADQARLRLELAVCGIGARAARRWGQRLGLHHIHLQGEGSLGCRLRRQLINSKRLHAPTVVIGTDLPELATGDLYQAIQRIQNHDLVLGPAKDGGYWLIGIGQPLLRTPQSWPLSGIPWGSNKVLEVTMAAAAAEGLSTSLLPERNDVDHLDDLAPWQG